MGARDNLRTDKTLGTSAEQEDTPAVRRTDEAAVCDPDPDAHNADRTASLLVQDQGGRVRPVSMRRGLADTKTRPDAVPAVHHPAHEIMGPIVRSRHRDGL